MRRALAVGVVGLLLLAPVACAERESGPWAAEAVRYFEAMDEAGGRSISEQVRRFHAEDVLLDAWRSPGFTCTGRDACIEWLTARAGAAADEVTTSALYLDATGAARAVRHEGPDADAGGLVVYELGADGRIAVEVRPRAVRAVDSVEAADLRRLTGLADAYREAWSSDDPTSVAALYAEDAVVVDSLAGVRAAGRDDVGRLARRSMVGPGPPTLQPDDLDGLGAVHLRFPDGSVGGEPTTVQLHLALRSDADGCTERSLVVLDVRDGAIRRERRFHEVESVRTCTDPADPESGWWEGVSIPALEDRITARLEVAGQRVAVRNGTPELERLVRWSLERFEDAGLPVPPVRLVAFDRDVHPFACPQERDGCCVTVGGASEVYVCADQDDVCADSTCAELSPRWRQLLLHELAHAWLAAHVDDTTERDLVALLGLPGWDWAGEPWPSRGIEQAAEIIAWGVVDDPAPLYRLGSPPCDRLARAFTLLTGRSPVHGCGPQASVDPPPAA